MLNFHAPCASGSQTRQQDNLQLNDSPSKEEIQNAQKEITLVESVWGPGQAVGWRRWP